MTASSVMSALSRCMQQTPTIPPALYDVARHLSAFSHSPWGASSSTSSIGTRHYSSSSSDAPATPNPSNSSSRQQQAASSFSAAPDAFTAHLQSKTEADVFNLLEKARATKLAEAAAAAAKGDAFATVQAVDAELEAEEDDTVDVINPETGEAYGPRGKEPTRYGDWEIKGRCTDFS